MIKMEKVVVNVGKTPKGYCASIDILPGWVLGVSGTFADFERKLAESVAIYVKWAKKDGDIYPAVFDGAYTFEYKFEIENQPYTRPKNKIKLGSTHHHRLGKKLTAIPA
jgi:hypothetical protein